MRFIRSIQKTTLCILVICFALISNTWAASRSLPIGKGKVGFWIGTSQNNVFDEQTLRFIADRAGMVILNATLQGPASAYNYLALVQRLHELQPGLPVLSYTWATRWHDTNRIGTETLAGYPDLGSLLVHNPKGRVIQLQQGKVFFGDVRQEKFRTWMVNQIQKMLKKTGTDGVALDIAIRSPKYTPKPLAELCERDPKFCLAYAQGMDALFSSLQTRLHPKIILYNGLWSLNEGMLEDQQKLLKHADAVAIEYFGMHPERGVPSFDKGVLPYIEILRTTLDKVFLVFGRGPWRYTDYREDYLWQRYLYCTYLLGAASNTLFKYHASFQIPAHAGRSGGLDVYRDWDLDLGNSLSSYQQHDGVYLRPFSKALVLVVPHDSTEKKYSLPHPMYTPEGERVEGTIVIRPGQGLLLLANAPQLPESVQVDFESSQTFNSWQWAEIRSKAGKQFLHLNRTPEGREWEHDLLLEPIRSLHAKPIVQIRLRTVDSNTKLLFIAEVDDQKQEYTQVVIEVGSKAKPSQGISLGQGIPFRITNTRDKLPYVTTEEADFKTDGQWYTITLDAERILGKEKRYAFRRWEYMRIIGTLDIAGIEILSKSL